MKITFDSNVWRIISSPEIFPNESSIDDFKAIRQAISENKIIPFLCETVFSLEAIQKKNRKEFFSTYTPKIDFTETIEEDGTIKISISMKSNKEAHPGNNQYLEKHLQDATSIGFKIIKLPRAGGIVNTDIEQYFYQHEDIKIYHKKVFEIESKIESKKAGIFHIQELGEKYHENWKIGIQHAPTHENGNIAKAIAEWADGDSVACHIAIDGDYFCTRDIAKQAGDTSIFSENNIKWLEEDYDFKIISPEDLAKILLSNNS